MKRSVLVAFLLAWSATPTRASSMSVITGTWNGVESIQVFDYVFGQQVGQSEQSNIPATFSFTAAFYGDPTTPGVLDLGIGSTEMNGASRGLTMGSGTISGSTQTGIIDNGGDFSATFQSIMPDGQIVVGDGIASAVIETNTGTTTGNGVVTWTHFTSVITPEPASIVQAASSILIIAICAWLRRL
jgi:hypothetical protein